MKVKIKQTFLMAHSYNARPNKLSNDTAKLALHFHWPGVYLPLFFSM